MRRRRRPSGSPGPGTRDGPVAPYWRAFAGLTRAGRGARDALPTCRVPAPRHCSRCPPRRVWAWGTHAFGEDAKPRAKSARLQLHPACGAHGYLWERRWSRRLCSLYIYISCALQLRGIWDLFFPSQVPFPWGRDPAVAANTVQ